MLISDIQGLNKVLKWSNTAQKLKQIRMQTKESGSYKCMFTLTFVSRPWFIPLTHLQTQRGFLH